MLLLAGRMYSSMKLVPGETAPAELFCKDLHKTQEDC